RPGRYGRKRSKRRRTPRGVRRNARSPTIWFVAFLDLLAVLGWVRSSGRISCGPMSVTRRCNLSAKLMVDDATGASSALAPLLALDQRGGTCANRRCSIDRGSRNLLRFFAGHRTDIGFGFLSLGEEIRILHGQIKGATQRLDPFARDARICDEWP